MSDEGTKERIRNCRSRLRMVMSCARKHLQIKRGGHRQAEVLALASIGLTDRQIAETLQASQETIGTHWQRVMKQLDAATRTEAVAIILEREIAALTDRQDTEQV